MTKGTHNVAIGYNAGEVTTGNYNVAIGQNGILVRDLGYSGFTYSPTVG
jgi:hypothetical protein